MIPLRSFAVTMRRYIYGLRSTIPGRSGPTSGPNRCAVVPRVSLQAQRAAGSMSILSMSYTSRWLRPAYFTPATPGVPSTPTMALGNSRFSTSTEISLHSLVEDTDTTRIKHCMVTSVQRRWRSVDDTTARTRSSRSGTPLRPDRVQYIRQAIAGDRSRPRNGSTPLTRKLGEPTNPIAAA